MFGSTDGLNNQTGISYELGGEWSGDLGRVLLTAYRLELDDEISYDPALFHNVNLDSTMRKGLILEVWAKKFTPMLMSVSAAMSIPRPIRAACW